MRCGRKLKHKQTKQKTEIGLSVKIFLYQHMTGNYLIVYM